MAHGIRFHLDENCSPVLADALRRRGIDVSTTQEEDLRAAADEFQLAFATQRRRVLVTHDTDFLALHQRGVAHSGIVYCQQQSRSIGDIVRGLVLIWELLDPEEMRGHVEFL